MSHFFGLDRFLELTVLPRTSNSVMNFAVAVGAEACHEARIIRTAIAQPPDMMRFQIRFSLCSLERSWEVTQFAYPSCSSQHIPANGLRSLARAVELT
jgi:hypothetical protein